MREADAGRSRNGGWTGKRDQEGVWGHTGKSRMEGLGISGASMGAEKCRQQVWKERELRHEKCKILGRRTQQAGPW